MALASGQAQRRARIQVRNSSASGENHTGLKSKSTSRRLPNERDSTQHDHTSPSAPMWVERNPAWHTGIAFCVAVEEPGDAVVVLDPQRPHHAGDRAARLLLVLEHGGGGGREVAAAAA